MVVLHVIIMVENKFLFSKINSVFWPQLASSAVLALAFNTDEHTYACNEILKLP